MRAFFRALSRAAVRAIGSPYAKPIARLSLVAAGLLLLAFIGRTAVAGALAASAATAPPASPPGVPPRPESTDPRSVLAVPSSTTAGSVASSPAAAALASAASVVDPHPPPPPSRGAASADDPVVLNTATVDDLRRLPGIGEKRAGAIVALRARVGRFRAVEDLLKVKGIGRATLKRLRPLMRLDPPPPSSASTDAGAPIASAPPAPS